MPPTSTISNMPMQHAHAYAQTHEQTHTIVSVFFFFIIIIFVSPQWFMASLYANNILYHSLAAAARILSGKEERVWGKKQHRPRTVTPMCEYICILIHKCTYGARENKKNFYGFFEFDVHVYFPSRFMYIQQTPVYTGIYIGL
jgi:hypothetical protein